MAWVNDYQPEAITPNIVERDGDYALKILDVTTGTIPANPEKNQPEKRFYRVECMIAAKGYPKISVFLTEGNNFNAIATAFFDTFGIAYGNWNTEMWKGLEGAMHIALTQKNGRKEMLPTYIVDGNGRVVRRMAPQSQPMSAPQPMPQQAPMGNGNSFGAGPALNDETIPF